MKALSRLLSRLIADRTALAAVEFAFILPVMLVMFFGTVEFSSAVAVDRKVTLIARTLSDLTSQSTYVMDADLNNFFAASNEIMTPYPTGWPSPVAPPYPATPLSATVTLLYIDSTQTAFVQWSVGSAPLAQKSKLSIPSSLAVANTWLIYSQVTYKYVPTVGYTLAKAGINLSDFSYTRPRQSPCVLYDVSSGACPQLTS